MNQIGLLGTAAYWQMRVNLAKTKNRIPTRDSHKQEAPHGHLVHSNKAGNSVGTDGEGLSNIMDGSPDFRSRLSNGCRRFVGLSM